MPKRSNDFQKLVYLVNKATSPKATVTESKMLQDTLEKGKEVEVDICLEQKIGGYDVCVSIECNENSRRADRSWVLAMKAKHDQLPTNKLVLASKKGFSASAVKVAELHNIQLLPYSILNANTVENIFGVGSHIWVVSFKLRPTHFFVGIETPGGSATNSVQAAESAAIYSTNKLPLCTVGFLARVLINHPNGLDLMAKDAKDDHNFFELVWTLPESTNQFELHIQMKESKEFRRIRQVRVHGQCYFKQAKVDLETVQLGPSKLSWGKGPIHDHDSIFVVSKNNEEGEVFSVDCRDLNYENHAVRFCTKEIQNSID